MPQSEFGFGRGVIAILEEFDGAIWRERDARLVLIGEWPVVGGYEGPGGGVVVITSSLGYTDRNTGLLRINLGPPAALRLGGAWRVSPTMVGEFGELRFYTNFTASSLTLAVQSTDFAIEFRELPGFDSPPDQTVEMIPGDLVSLNLQYAVEPPRLTFDLVSGLAIVGTPETAYRIEFTPDLSPETHWSPQTTLTLGAGANRLEGSNVIDDTRRLYRAVWLPD